MDFALDELQENMSIGNQYQTWIRREIIKRSDVADRFDKLTRPALRITGCKRVMELWKSKKNIERKIYDWISIVLKKRRLSLNSKAYNVYQSSGFEQLHDFGFKCFKKIRSVSLQIEKQLSCAKR